MNQSEVRVGQVWDYNKRAGHYSYLMRIRTICRYPFAEATDGPLWVVESYPGLLGKIYRLPELSLRLLYDLAEEVPEA